MCGNLPAYAGMADQHLLTSVEDFLTETGMAESAFGRGAVKDWKLVRDLRNGRRLWPETEAKVRKFMADYQPSPAKAAAA